MATETALENPLALSNRAKWIVRAALVVVIGALAFWLWTESRPPTIEEQYRTLMGADELIGNTSLTFERMSSPQSLAEATDQGSAIVYGHFDGPSERDLVVYELFEDVESATSAFAAHRESAATYPGYRDTPFYEEGDYQVVTPTYAQYATRLDNVVLLGEAWRSSPKAIDDTTLDRRAQSMVMIAMKNYLRLLGQ